MSIFPAEVAQEYLVYSHPSFIQGHPDLSSTMRRNTPTSKAGQGGGSAAEAKADAKNEVMNQEDDMSVDAPFDISDVVGFKTDNSSPHMTEQDFGLLVKDLNMEKDLEVDQKQSKAETDFSSSCMTEQEYEKLLINFY